ncbi:hypothetical protein [Herpetosiphon giganteus]|uniref:hypothetical protein n=1 Tax=Herpetosiphon giganteus TaxID=2029754 RepID=UPI00195A45FC|nr:hypothetical protein [Herpetosiphon giganteus]MBM7845392.1 hypothetical protein [Herpetosiphon giganteus]
MDTHPDEIDLTADPAFVAWLHAGVEWITANTCPQCSSRTLRQRGEQIECCTCLHQWTVTG